MSLLEQGKQFCLKQVAAGLNAFASVLSDELHSFQDLRLHVSLPVEVYEFRTEGSFLMTLSQHSAAVWS